MLRIDRERERLQRLPKKPLEHWERRLQAMICRDSRPFFDELDEDFLLVGQEVRPSESVTDRIDVLAIDADGQGVVIELKRGTHKLQLLQAISYAGMISRWSGERYVEAYAATHNREASEARDDIEQHLRCEFAKLNQSQRIVLIAEDFDPALLSGAEWLSEQYGVDVRCYRIALWMEDDGREYLTCTCIYPPLEVADLRRRPAANGADVPERWSDWQLALEAVDNEAMVGYFRAELARSCENYLKERMLIYRIEGTRRLFVACRRRYAYVWQEGRFTNDESFWRELLSKPESVTPVKSGHALRFLLFTKDDFARFSKQ